MRWIFLFVLLTSGSLGASGQTGLLAQASSLQARGLAYGARFLPPGELSPWSMDCSNASRYLVRQTRGISLPRSASAQYNYVRRHGRIKRVGGLFGGVPATRWWAKRLKPGDLLFWEHTYKPRRNPPVTHVMVYLGTDQRGRLLMAGSQSSRGVGIYRLYPRMVYGGHGGFLGLFKKKGRLVAYGRL